MALARNAKQRLVKTHLVLALCLPAAPSFADWQVNLVEGVTEISRAVFDLHMTIFWICVAIAVVVFGIMLWSVVYHRKSRGAEAQNFHESTKVEIAWTLVPIVILVAMAIPATATLIKMYDSSEAALDVQITAYQWKWRYQYLEHDIDFFSSLATPREQIENQQQKTEHYLLEVDNPLVIPAGEKVRFLLTSNDVIHSWWVPAFAVKKDAIPGFINEAWTKVDKPGIYRGQCAELCGKDHGFMPIVVEVKSPEDYQNWLLEQQRLQRERKAQTAKHWSLAELMEKGEKVYMTRCAACHQADGKGMAGVFPALAGSPLVRGEVKGHIDMVLNGVKGTAMQAFAEQLSALELAAVITYERNAWGDASGDIVTPQQVQQRMAKAAE